MDIALSTQLSQDALATQVDAAVARKSLDAQKLEGQNTLTLLQSAFTDPALGNNVDYSV